jgi:phosphotransferase system enzyme I (PtsI)
MPQEIDSVFEHGGEGVGLFRTEYLYLSKDSLPTEEEHYQVYKSIAERLHPKPIVIRTLDIGGDKFLENYHRDEQLNPAMGLRAIRFCFREKEIFKTQLKGIIRASKEFNNIKILIPMVSGIKEINETKKIIDECEKELNINSKTPLGIMIEIPSAAILSDIFAQKVDFLSIGTNDLIQYTLAIDRLNQDVTYLYEPAHPAVLRLIATTVKSAKDNGITVNMCGEMAGEVLYTPILVAMGIDALSMNPVAIPFIKEIICNLTLFESKAILDDIMKFEDCKTIESYLKEKMHKKFKDFSFIF